jgi:hypothetical protein
VISAGYPTSRLPPGKLIEYSRGLKKLTGFRLVALVRAAARFVNGELSKEMSKKTRRRTPREQRL